jgi:predicted DsbA family dithiol-disulfide isomerase
LKKEFDIREEWVSYEIHPETPEKGVALAERFPQMRVEQMYEQLRRSGAPFGIVFNDVKLLSNSRKALEASEFARAEGKFAEFHEAVFRAYFTELKDIGKIEVLLDLAEQTGLDRVRLKEALDQGVYLKELEKASVEGQQYGITGTPTFIINNRYAIVGAHPLDGFRRVLKQIAEREGQ